MAKKCIPGVLCVENMTLFMLVVIFALVVYMFSISGRGPSQSPVFGPSPGSLFESSAASPNVVVVAAAAASGGGSGVVGDMYSAPLRFEEPLFRGNSLDPRGAPINMRTRGTGDPEYSQVGILTDARDGAQSDIILPLFGRRSDTGRDKHQYYTVSNSGSLNTRLPVSLSGKSCAGEYGCDEISSGDVVFTAGYGGDFKATMYESGLNRYIPF